MNDFGKTVISLALFVVTSIQQAEPALFRAVKTSLEPRTNAATIRYMNVQPQKLNHAERKRQRLTSKPS